MNFWLPDRCAIIAVLCISVSLIKISQTAAAPGGSATQGETTKEAASGGMTVSLTASHSRSTSESESRTVGQQAAGLVAGERISLTARGTDGATGTGNLTLTGVDASARDIALKANHDLLIQSAQNSSQSREKHEMLGGTVGVAATAQSSGGAALGVTGSVQYANGYVKDERLTQLNSHLTAGNSVSIQTGNDATLAGAVVKGEHIKAEVDGDLTLQSRQDTATYRAQDLNAHISATVGAGASASGGLGFTRTTHDYAAVTEQTRLQAGTGGFDIKTQGHTQLDGAVIASTADTQTNPIANRLQTGSLGTSDIDNKDKTSSFSLNVSMSSVGGV